MHSIEIIRLRAEHAGRLADFFKTIDTSEYRKDFAPHPFNEEYAKFVCNYDGSDLYFSVLHDGKEIIGYGILRGWDEGYEVPSIGLCILKKYQGSGLGRLLLNFLEIVSRLRGCSTVMLKVKKDNPVAKKLYESQGYDLKEHNEDFLIGYKKIS